MNHGSYGFFFYIFTIGKKSVFGPDEILVELYSRGVGGPHPLGQNPRPRDGEPADHVAPLQN